jgi:hypothetical protein
MVENSWRTASMVTKVMAAPGMEERRTRRSDELAEARVAAVVEALYARRQGFYDHGIILLRGEAG